VVLGGLGLEPRRLAERVVGLLDLPRAKVRARGEVPELRGGLSFREELAEELYRPLRFSSLDEHEHLVIGGGARVIVVFPRRREVPCRLAILLCPAEDDSGLEEARSRARRDRVEHRDRRVRAARVDEAPSVVERPARVLGVAAPALLVVR